jgi:hypothetical protein
MAGIAATAGEADMTAIERPSAGRAARRLEPGRVTAYVPGPRRLEGRDPSPCHSNRVPKGQAGDGIVTPYQVLLLLVLVSVWLWAAIEPIYPRDWLLDRSRLWSANKWKTKRQTFPPSPF